jgi:hypothetical protein
MKNETRTQPLPGHSAVGNRPSRKRVRDFLFGRIGKTKEETAQHNKNLRRGQKKRPKKRVAFL